MGVTGSSRTGPFGAMAPTRTHGVLWAVLGLVVVVILAVTLTTGWPRHGLGALLYGTTTLTLWVVWCIAMWTNRPGGWGWPVMTVALGFWTTGDLFRQVIPQVSEVAYLAAYATTCFGMLWLLGRARRLIPKVALLDMAIAAVAVTTCVGALVIHPRLEAGAAFTFDQVPVAVAEVGFLALVVQLWATFPLTNRSLRLFLLAATCYVTSDILTRATGASQVPPDVLEITLQLAFVICVAAGLDPSSVEIGQGRAVVRKPAAIQEVGLMAAAIAVIGATLAIDGWLRDAQAWPFVAVGIVLVGALITWRMWQLLDTVQRQADAMTEAASLDPLTGLANRRVWDAAIAEPATTNPPGPDPQWVAVLDIDHFKVFNDDYGHPAGDRLLKQAALAWTPCLDETAVLARIGGEEFGLLLRGHDTMAAHDLVETLRGLLPLGQTCSAGLARRERGEPLAETQRRADEALYQAKADGRDRTVVATRTVTGLPSRTPRVRGAERLNARPSGDSERLRVNRFPAAAGTPGRP